MNDFSGYTSSLNNTFASIPGLSKTQEKQENKIKEYNARVNQILSPLGDEFIRQSSDIITGGIQKGLKLGFGGGTKKIAESVAGDKPGLLGGDFVNVDRIKKSQPQKLLRNDAHSSNDIPLQPHSPSRGLGNILTDEEQQQLTLQRAQESARKSGQILQQTGVQPDPDTLASAQRKLDQNKRVQMDDDDDDDDDDFKDVRETNIDEAGKNVEEATENIGRNVEREGLKEGERFGEKFAEGEAEGGGPEDPGATVLAIGLGVASLFAQKKLQKADIEAPQAQTISPNFARGL